MKRQSTLILFAACVALSFGFVLSGCKKDKETIATVKVVNEDGDAIPGATVRLYSVPSEDEPRPNELRFDTTQVTNGTGIVTFDFSEFYKKGQAGFVVLDIEAYKGSLNGDGIIKIEEETTTEEVIEID
jgi:hypothetical protein